MTDTPTAPDRELELIRRLADLADTTTVDDGAWDAIQRRLTPVANPWARRSPWRLAAMAAAAVVLIVGALAMTRHEDDGGRVDIQEEDKDRDTTTTVDEDDEDPTPTTAPGVTTTIAPGFADEGVQSPSGDPANGTGPSDDTGGARGSTGTGTGTGSGAGSGGGGGSGTTVPVTTVPPGGLMEDGHPPAVQVQVAGQTVLTTLFMDGQQIWMNIWHGPDEWLTNFAWDDQPRQNCLVGEGAAFTFPGAGTFTFDWGIVRSDAAEVRIVMQDGSFAAAAIGSEAVPGVRAWLGVRPAGTLDHYEVRDSAGGLLHTATPPFANSLPDFCP